MIVRILTARVPDRHAAAFEDVLREQLPLMRQQPGLVYLKLARQSHRGYDDVVLFEEWRDANALYGWTGANIEKPRLLPGAEGLAEYVRVTHYEALDVDPAQVMGLDGSEPFESLESTDIAGARGGSRHDR